MFSLTERFEFLALLGQGSIGTVYCCRDKEGNGKFVALKVLHPELIEDAESRQRFLNQVFTSHSILHPHVVRAYEYFASERYMSFSMEYLKGGDLARKLETTKRFSVISAVQYLIQLCEGLEAIHDAQIIHRNLKAENILLDTHGKLKICDFCCSLSDNAGKINEHGGILASIDHVAPEYVTDGKITKLVDIYSLGLLAFELFTGFSPFQGKSVYETMKKRISSIIPSVRAFRPEVTTALEETIFRCLAKKPEDRYQSAKELKTALIEVLRSGFGGRDE